MAGVLEDGVALVDKLEAADVPLFGLINWSAETFPWAWEQFPVLQRFAKWWCRAACWSPNQIRRFSR
ncbi:MAG: Hydrolase (EC [uncultured Caballeronia sp.]|nr:MAG: Hydrolase (EC [uncultured Caballeronia sp.]